MKHTARQLSLLSLLASLIFASAAYAQQLGAVGGLNRSVSGLDGGVSAEVGGQPKSETSGGKGAVNKTQSSMWSTKPGSGAGGNAEERIGSWSPEREGKQSARSRLSASAAPGAPMTPSPGNKTGSAPPEMAKKEKGVKPLLPPGGIVGPESDRDPFAFQEFTGKGHHTYSTSRVDKKKSREKLAEKFKGGGSPVPVSKKRKGPRKPARDSQAHDEQGCADSSKLRLCTWFSSR